MVGGLGGAGETGRGIHPRRGEVYYVEFDPAFGAEIRKTRPALILQNDVGNRQSLSTIVAAISSRRKGYIPTEVPLRAPEGGLRLDSVVRLDQIRTVDKRRLRGRLGALDPSTMARVDRALRVSLGLVETGRNPGGAPGASPGARADRGCSHPPALKEEDYLHGRWAPLPLSPHGPGSRVRRRDPRRRTTMRPVQTRLAATGNRGASCPPWPEPLSPSRRETKMAVLHRIT
jgi:mRNA interferase MazF